MVFSMKRKGKYILLISVVLLMSAFWVIHHKNNSESFSYLSVALRESMVGPPKEVKICVHPASGNALYLKIEKLMENYEKIYEKTGLDSHVAPDSNVLVFELHSRGKTKKFELSTWYIYKNQDEPGSIKEMSSIAKECLAVIQYEFNIPWEVLLYGKPQI